MLTDAATATQLGRALLGVGEAYATPGDATLDTFWYREPVVGAAGTAARFALITRINVQGGAAKEPPGGCSGPGRETPIDVSARGELLNQNGRGGVVGRCASCAEPSPSPL